MTLYSRISSRVSYVAGLARFMAFAETHPHLPIEKVEQTFPVRSKAEADQIAESLGARAMWRDGYYMAELKGMEIHFAPLITERDASTGGADGAS